MALFVCRWPNGDFSFVQAASKEAGLTALQQVGDPMSCCLSELSDFLAHFPSTGTAKVMVRRSGEPLTEAIFASNHNHSNGSASGGTV